MATADPWNRWAVEQIKTYCYAPDGEPPKHTTLAQDLRWVKWQLVVKHESRERISMALQGAPLVWEDLQHTKWSPAKCFSKKGTWAKLFDRAITALGKHKVARQNYTPQFRDVFKAIAEKL